MRDFLESLHTSKIRPGKTQVITNALCHLERADLLTEEREKQVRNNEDLAVAISRLGHGSALSSFRPVEVLTAEIVDMVIGHRDPTNLAAVFHYLSVVHIPLSEELNKEIVECSKDLCWLQLNMNEMRYAQTLTRESFMKLLGEAPDITPLSRTPR